MLASSTKPEDERTGRTAIAMSVSLQSYAVAGTTGAGAGVIASIVQVVVGAMLDRMLLPPGHDNNIAPRLVHRTARKLGHRSSAVLDWLVGIVFHVGYGIGWGVLFGVFRKWSRLPSLPLGGLLGGVIYLAAFAPFGVATRTGSER